MALSKAADETRMQIEETLSCPVCLKFFTQPKTLVCGHTFCQDCIEESLRLRQSKKRKTTYPCPVCRSSTKVSDIPGALPDNVTVKQMIDIYHDTSALCTICIHLKKRVPATSCCFQCSQLLCIECTGKHSGLKTYEHHFIMPLEREHSSVKCKLHTNEMYKTYCMQCREFLCQVCVITGHSEHGLQSIEEAIETWKQLSFVNLPQSEKMFNNADAEVIHLKLMKDSEMEMHTEMTQTLHEQINRIQILASCHFRRARISLDDQASARQNKLQARIDDLESTLKVCRKEHTAAKQCSTLFDIMCAIRDGVDTVGILAEMTHLTEDINPQDPGWNPKFIATPDSSLSFGSISLGTDGEFIDLSKLADVCDQHEPGNMALLPDATKEQESKSTSLHFRVKDIWNKDEVETGGVAFRDCWWSLLAKENEEGGLSLHLICKSINPLNSSWQCQAKAKISLLGKGETIDRGFNHMFIEKEHGWGYKEFASDEEVSDRHRGFVKNGNFEVRVELEADQLTYRDK